MVSENNELLNPNKDFTEMLNVRGEKVEESYKGNLITESQLKSFNNDVDEVQSNQTIISEQKNKVLDEILSANASVPLNVEYKLNDNINEIANIAEMQTRIDKIGVNRDEVNKFNNNISPDIATTLEKLRSEDAIIIPSLESYTPVYSNVNIKQFKYILTKAYGMSLDKFNQLVSSYNNIYQFNNDWITALKPNISNAQLKKSNINKAIIRIKQILNEPDTYRNIKQKLLVSTIYMLDKYLTTLLNEEEIKTKSFEWIFKLKKLYDELIENKDTNTIAGHNAFLRSKFSKDEYILRNLSIILFDCECSKNDNNVTIENGLGVLLELINAAYYRDIENYKFTDNGDICKVVAAYEDTILPRVTIVKNNIIPDNPFNIVDYIQNSISYLNDAIVSTKLIDTINVLYEAINGYQDLIMLLPKIFGVHTEIDEISKAMSDGDYNRVIELADSFIQSEQSRANTVITISQYQQMYSRLLILGDSLIELLAMYGDEDE